MAATTKEVPDQIVASIRKQIPQDQVGPFIPSSAIALIAQAKEQGLDIVGRGFTIYHKQGEDVDVEICLPVAKPGEKRGDITFRTVKGGSATSLLVTGN